MATVEEITLKVNALEAAQSVKDLRGSMGELRKIVNETKIGSDEYKAALDGVQKAQNMLANATKLGVTETAKAEKSYNALSREMAELKQQFKSATTEADRMKVAPKIKEINDQLKSMDASVGVFGRNVGNYAQGVAEGFSSIGGAAGGMVSPIKGVTTGFQVLSKTPVIAILGLLVNIITAVIGQMKKSEEGTQALSKVMGILSNTMDIASKGLQWLGKGFAWVIDKTTDLLKKFKLLGDESNKRIGIEQKEIALAQEKRRVTMANADAELKIAKLRAESTDKINKSASERLALIKEAAELEQETYKNNYNLAKQEYELIKEKNSLLPSSSQELQAEADAYASMVQAETAYYNKQREYNSQMSEAFNQAKQSVTELKEAISPMEVSLNEALERLAEFRAKTNEKILSDEAVFQEDLFAFEEEHAKDVIELEKLITKNKDDEAKKQKALIDREKKWQRDKYTYIGSLASSASKIAGENTAIGKALAVASTTISTYQAAQQAYASQIIPGEPTSIIRAVLAASTAVASGIANVKSILAVKTDGSTTSMPNISGASVQTYAPAVVQNVPVTRTLTGASEEAKLNQILDNTSATASGTNRPVKAYVVASEMQGELLYEQQTEAEASF